ncbi:MAG: MaoC family dehydratase N-terminal domain-containing protein [Microvirga sp.]
MEADFDHLRAWVGRTEARADLLTLRLAEAFDATLDEPPRAYESGDTAPLGIHWCLGNPAVRASGLGRDGHPKREGFMPPVPLPRRMWAAGKLTFAAPLLVGLNVTRQTTIAAIDLKHGRTGPLFFLELDHLYLQEGVTCVTERQTLVYREDPKPGGARAEAGGKPGPPEDRIVQTLTPDAVMLFRYSALTFNGHRIHYDLAYAGEVEGYPGLVVHGPLIATLLMRACAAARPEHRLGELSFRGLSPSFAGEPLEIRVAEDLDGFSATATSRSRPVMSAKAAFCG